MPKPPLIPELELLERDIISTLLAGLKQWRPDLNYPESTSDMQGCVRALLISYNVERLPVPRKLASPCPSCKGLGEFIQRTGPSSSTSTTCPDCKHGKVYY